MSLRACKWCHCVQLDKICRSLLHLTICRVKSWTLCYLWDLIQEKGIREWELGHKMRKKTRMEVHEGKKMKRETKRLAYRIAW